MGRYFSWWMISFRVYLPPSCQCIGTGIVYYRSSTSVVSGVRVTRSWVLFVSFVDRCLLFFFCPLCFLSSVDLRILITSMVSSNISYYKYYLSLSLSLSQIIFICQSAYLIKYYQAIVSIFSQTLILKNSRKSAVFPLVQQNKAIYDRYYTIIDCT